MPEKTHRPLVKMLRISTVGGLQIALLIFGVSLVVGAAQVFGLPDHGLSKVAEILRLSLIRAAVGGLLVVAAIWLLVVLPIFMIGRWKPDGPKEVAMAEKLAALNARRQNNKVPPDARERRDI